MKTLLARTLDQRRDWLAKHHASESEVWLIFYKRHTGVAWIESAKREETKRRRLEEAIRLLANGKVLGLK
jgi:uncharacterized protein YdeI (YjbR/CyaY-like superfamily)